MNCPYCGYAFELHETLDGFDKPKDGDVSICINCGNMGMFKGNEIVKIDIDTLEKMPKETIDEVDKIKRAWRKTI